MTDTNVAEKIVEAAQLNKDDIVLEIGPGMGALTEILCKRAGRVVAVEIDKWLIGDLNEKMSAHENFRLINDDILKLNIPGILQSDVYKVISNLPYYITTPIIMKFIESITPPKRMVLMMQKEVADRIVAEPSTKSYGSLTVSVNYYSKPKKAFNVSPHCFVPQPGVESSVLIFDSHLNPPVELLNRELFFRVVKAAFSQRRKQLMNCLIHAKLLPNDRLAAGLVLSKVGVDLKVRGEELDMAAFARLSNEIYSSGNGSIIY